MRGRIAFALLLSALVALLLAGAASGQVGFGFDLRWNVLSGGGGVGPLAGSGYSLNGTLGQTAIGPTVTGGWLTAQGFWYGMGPAGPPTFGVYLPVVFKGFP